VARASGIGGSLITRTGPFLTLSIVTGVRALGDELHDRFGALCESMEGAAAAHVCALHDIPFLEVRGISNLVEDRDRSKWRITEAAEAAQTVALKLAESLS
jgi:futalosine hydrolase